MHRKSDQVTEWIFYTSSHSANMYKSLSDSNMCVIQSWKLSKTKRYENIKY